MAPGERALFVAAYSRLVTEVWADPAQEARLDTDPAALAASVGMVIPDSTRVEVVRTAHDAEPSLDVQVEAWAAARESGVLRLFVPATDPTDDADLVEHELDRVVAGLDTSCACCCPCCCSS